MNLKKMVINFTIISTIAGFATPALAATNTVKEGSFTLVKSTIAVNGKTKFQPYVFAAKDPNSGAMTTFVPIWYVMQVMTKAGVTNSWNGVTHTLTLKGGNGGIKAIHGAKGNATIVWNGLSAETGVPSFSVIDPNSGKLTTFFGLYYAEKMLDAMGFNNVWNGTKHTWTMTLPVASTQGGSGQTAVSSVGPQGQKWTGTSSTTGLGGWTKG